MSKDGQINLTELNQTPTTSNVTNELEYEYKWCCFKPRLSHEKFNWKFTFTFLCLCCFFQNFVTSGTSTVILSTVEREFFWSSTQSGFFLGLFELAAFIAAPIFGFLGGYINKMKLISVSLFIVMLGSYTIGFTIFFKEPDFDANNFNTNKSYQLCHSSLDVTNNETECNLIRNGNSISSNLQYLVFIGHFIIGLGSVALYTIGVAYIEEITTVKQSSYCQAIYYGLGAVGGGIGILITGQFLNLNSRFYLKSYKLQYFINSKSVLWIGAWWLPYLIYGSICAFLGIILYGFPSKSYNKDKPNASTPQKSSNKKLNKLERIKSNLIEFLNQIKRAFKNLTLILIVFATASEGILLKGFLGFISKYFEYQFQMTASTSTLITGSIALISVIAGTLSSAFVINKWKWAGKECSLFCSIIYFVTSFCFWIFLNYCSEDIFANNECLNCSCRNKFNPVCLPSNYTSGGVASKYQSACHAGCQSMVSNTEFSNCQCLNINSTQSNFTKLILTSDNCDKSIKCIFSLIFNCVAATLVIFFTAFALIPQLKACLSTVGLEFQPFALGIRAGVVRIVGNFSGSIIVGKAVDLTCKYWLKNCYGQETCKLYHNNKMSLALAVIGFSCRFITAILMGLACLLIIRKDKKLAKNKQLNRVNDQSNNVQVVDDKVMRF